MIFSRLKNFDRLGLTVKEKDGGSGKLTLRKVICFPCGLMDGSRHCARSHCPVLREKLLIELQVNFFLVCLCVLCVLIFTHRRSPSAACALLEHPRTRTVCSVFLNRLVTRAAFSLDRIHPALEDE